MLDDLQAYRRWEAEHDRLMRSVANERNRMGQLVALRSAAFALIHRKALFEYLRDQKVTGRKRHEVFKLVYGDRDYAKSVVAGARQLSALRVELDVLEPPGTVGPE